MIGYKNNSLLNGLRNYQERAIKIHIKGFNQKYTYLSIIKQYIIFNIKRLTMSAKENCYFSHDANAKDDFKVMLLIEELGLEGYGIFWILIETLREQQDYKYPIKLLSVLSRKYNTTLAKVETVVRNYHLFEIEDECFFYSRSLNRRMEVMHKAIEQRKIAGQISAAKRKKNQEEQLKQLEMKLSDSDSTQRPLNECSTSVQQIKEKEIKEKEIKEKEKKEKEKKEKRSVEEDIRFLSNLSARDIEKKQISQIVHNVELFEKTGFTLEQLVTYSRDFESYLRAELSKHELKIK